MRKTAIIGSGPAGWTAAIYAARAALGPLVISGVQVGGQMTLTTEVDNYPGFANGISGPDLMKAMEMQARRFDVEVKNADVLEVEVGSGNSGPFSIRCDDGAMIEAETVIVATGASAKWLGVEGEERLRGRGVSACATCDAFFFRDREVAVIGGGNTALEEAIFLTAHASKVYLIHRRDALRGDKHLQKRVFDNPKIEILWNYVVTEAVGTDSLESLALKSTKGDPEIRRLPVSGAFVAIGHLPNTGPIKDKIKLTENGYVWVSPGSTRCSVPGIFAAGDVADPNYRQAITAAAMGCMAAIDAERFLESKK